MPKKPPKKPCEVLLGQSRTVFHLHKVAFFTVPCINQVIKLNAKFKIILAMATFGTIGLFVTNIPLSSASIAMARGFTGSIFLLLFALIRRQKICWQDIKKNIVVLALTGAFIGINWILLFEGYTYSVTKATLCYYLEPVFLVVVSGIIYKEKIRPINAVCVLVALLGMGFVSGVFPFGAVQPGDMGGILFGTGAAVFYTLVILINRKIKNISSYDMTMVQLFFAALVTVPYVLATENVLSVNINAVQVMLLLILGVVHTGIAYVLYFSSVRDLSSQSVAIFSYVDPMVAIVLSMTVLGEELTVWGILGAVMILGSTLISELKKK